MGKRKETDAELWARAEANGYTRGAHVEEDKVRDADKYISETKAHHDRTLEHYLRWQIKQLRDDHERKGLLPPDEPAARRHFLGKGVPAPDLATVKDFLRFYAATSKGKIDRKKKKPTADTLCTVGEWFFAGHARVTGAETTGEDRSEVYYWVRRTLVREGIVVNKHRPKHNFGLKDLNRVNLAEWTCDDLIYIHPRNRVQSTWLRHVYCWTGARIDTFFKGGILYKDVDLVLQRVKGGKDGRDWRVIYKLDQRFVKNNRDPEDVAFGAAAKEDGRLFYNDAGFLLALAFADGALYGYDTLADLRQQVIPADRDELPLRFKKEVLNLPIARKCTKSGGVTDEPMPMSQFLAITKSSLVNAGYHWSLSIHAIRRKVGQGLDRRYTAVERSQHLLQNDTRVFGQSYVANCSSVDGQAAFREEESDHRHVEYFQSLEKFHENGLPTRLPAHMEKELERDPDLRNLEAEVRRLRTEGNNRDFTVAQRRLTTQLTRLKKDALDLYQDCWIQERRDWIVQSRGREKAQDESKTELAPSIYKLFPERGRLAQAMASTHALPAEEMWAALQDLVTLCHRGTDVLYLPGSRPINGACPICQRRMNSLPKYQRNQHIQTCVRRDMATRKARVLSDIKYCYLCFDWVVGEEWEPHCQAHLDSFTAKRCGTVSHCHTLVRPGYCPLCVADDSLPASERLKAWSRDHFLWKHVEDKHLIDCQWPLVCPSCDSPHNDLTSFECHLVDTHRFSRSRPVSEPDLIRQHTPDEGEPLDSDAGGARPHRKRKSPSTPGALTWMPPPSLGSTVTVGERQLYDRPRKRRRRAPPTPTICPEAISIDEDVSDDCIFNKTLDPIALTTPSLNENGMHSDPDDGPHGSPYPTIDETSHFLEVADVDDDLESDTWFDQYIRSPSPPLLLNDATSEASETTLVELEREPSLDAEPRIQRSESPDPEPVLVREMTRDQQDGSQVKTCRQLRLRVGQPRITLRLRLGDSGRATKQNQCSVRGITFSASAQPSFPDYDQVDTSAQHPPRIAYCPQGRDIRVIQQYVYTIPKESSGSDVSALEGDVWAYDLIGAVGLKKGKTGKVMVMYHVKWKGLPISGMTWEPENHLPSSDLERLWSTHGRVDTSGEISCVSREKRKRKRMG